MGVSSYAKYRLLRSQNWGTGRCLDSGSRYSAGLRRWWVVDSQSAISSAVGQSAIGYSVTDQYAAGKYAIA